MIIRVRLPFDNRSKIIFVDKIVTIEQTFIDSCEISLLDGDRINVQETEQEILKKIQNAKLNNGEK